MRFFHDGQFSPSKHLFLCALLLVLFIFPSTTRAAETVTVRHGLGTATVPVKPERIVVFDLSVLDSIDAMGVTGVSYAVPQENMPGYLAKYVRDDVLDAGTMTNPDVANIAGFKPEVIFISPFQKEFFDKMSAIAPTIYFERDDKDFLGGFERSMDALGRIFAMKGISDEKAQAILDQAEEVAGKAKESGKNALIIMVADKTISAFGPGSRFGLVHDILGLAPADPTIPASEQGHIVDMAYITKTNPDILFVIDRDAALGSSGANSVSALLDTDQVAQTSAGKTGRIVFLDSGVWYLAGAGAESLSIMIGEVGKALDEPDTISTAPIR